jgi:hypothetical protein
VVIISGWEFTSSGYRRKERLIYAIREMMRDQDVAVIIYSRAETKPTPGKFDRGGIGTLAVLAIAIITASAAEVLEIAVPKPLPMIVSTEDWKKAEESAQLLASKMNDLAGVESEIAGSVTVMNQGEAFEQNIIRSD